MKRTSLFIEEELIKEIAKEAAKQGMTQTNLIRHLLTNGLKNFRQGAKNKNKFEWVGYGKGGLKDGVELENKTKLWDYLDQQEKK